MKIQIEKTYQSPCTPPTNLEYVVRISEYDDKEAAEEIDTIVGYLEDKYWKAHFENYDHSDEE